MGGGATHRQRSPRRGRGRHHGRQVRRRFIEKWQVGRRLGPANHAIEVLENAREIGAFAGRARGAPRRGAGRHRLVPHVELAQRTARVPVADRKVGRGRRGRLRKLVPAIPAAVRRLETDVAAGRTLHCTVLMASADDGSEVASSVRWMSASSLSASARFGSSSETVAIRRRASRALPCAKRSRARCQREVARARQRHRLGGLGRAQRRAGIRAPAAQIRDGAGKAGHERDGQNACRDECGRPPRMTPRAARRGSVASLDRNGRRRSAVTAAGLPRRSSRPRYASGTSGAAPPSMAAVSRRRAATGCPCSNAAAPRCSSSSASRCRSPSALRARSMYARALACPRSRNSTRVQTWIACA